MFPRCPKCLKRGPTGFCDLHAEWYSDMVCMDCNERLTEETYAEDLVRVGPSAEPWENTDDFDVARRVADVVEIVCRACRKKRHAEVPQ